MDDTFYKSLISNGPIGYVHLKAIYDELGLVCDFMIVEINQMFLEITGKSEVEILNKSFNEVSLGFNFDTKRFINEHQNLFLTRGYSVTKYQELTGQYYTIIFNKISDSDIIVYLTECDFTRKLVGDPLIIEETAIYFVDLKTGLYNRTYFDEVIVSLDKKENFPLGFLVCDINDMKQINSRFGRKTGDFVVNAVADLLRRYEDSGFIVAKTGDDEFAMVLPNTSQDVFYKLMIELQEKFELIRHKTFDENFVLQVSVGYQVKNHESENINEVFKVAEDYMMRRKFIAHKHSGKDGLASIKAMMVNNSHETNEHMDRMAELALRFADKVEMKQATKDDLYLLAMLHDIGKIGIPTHVLTKPGPLTADEWVEMKKHPVIGYDIAMASLDISAIAESILTHHERWDGKGYPKGLLSTDIPLLSRIVSIIDSYDAMTEDRPYRPKMTHEKAIEEITRCKGSQFDPELADIFISLFE